MFLSELGYSELVQRLFEKMTFFHVDPLEVAGNMLPQIIALKLPVVKARVPNQKRPREWRVGLMILGGCFSR
jgi:hypothetical protein